VENSAYVKECLKTAQNYLLEVDRFFEQSHKWYQDAPTVEKFSLIGSHIPRQNHE